MVSPLDHDPKSPHYRSEHPRDKVFGANTNAFSSRFSGFSICHPICHENTMLLATRHAIYSAKNTVWSPALLLDDPMDSLPARTSAEPSSNG